VFTAVDLATVQVGFTVFVVGPEMLTENVSAVGPAHTFAMIRVPVLRVLVSVHETEASGIVNVADVVLFAGIETPLQVSCEV
jgi:hypothetical protein